MQLAEVQLDLPEDLDIMQPWLAQPHACPKQAFLDALIRHHMLVPAYLR